MIFFVYLAMAVFYLFGAWAFHKVLKNRPPAEKRTGWTKYWVYLILIVGISACLFWLPGLFLPFSVIVILFGFYEVCKIFLQRPHLTNRRILLIFPLSVFSVISAGFLIFTRLPQGWMIITFLTIVSFDGFSQITGQLLGKHALAPRISPKKTVEGFIGGSTMGILTTICLRSSVDFSIPGSVFLGGLITLTAFSGDLLASWYKRRCGVKDFSNLIPGHGGVLDRFDSFLSTGAVIGLFYYITYVN